MTATITTSEIHSLLGAEAEALLTYEAKGFPKETLHLPGPDYIDRVFAHTDRSPSVLRNYAHILGAGRLAVVCCLFPVALIFMKLPTCGPGSTPFTVTVVGFLLVATALVWWGFRQYQVPVLMASSITAMALLLAVLAPA